MSELLTAAQMREIEQAAIQSGKVSGLELMERAGGGVVESILTHWPDLSEGRFDAVILCGPGNNGGDGFVIARLLAARGWAVSVYLLGDVDSLPPDARTNAARWAELGAIGAVADYGGAVPDLFVDALFGTGLTRGIAPEAVAPFEALFEGGARTVAVDVPSGVCSDSGRVLGQGVAVQADLTVSFHRAKLGHVLAEGAEQAGSLVVHDIGLTEGCAEAAQLVTPPTTLEVGKGGAHKYDSGHAIVLGGAPGQGGAARMAARGALRIGAGLVTLACPLRAVAENAVHVNAIMLRGMDGPHGLHEILEDHRVSALCLGPGLGLTQATAELVKVALQSGLPVVLDADALSRFQRQPQALFDMLHGDVVLTPHMGEFARLFPDLAERLEDDAESGPAFSKVDAVREAAARAGCVVLLKGADTVIADPAGACVVHSAHGARSAPWLATAGAGDVLAGFICGLMARHVPAFAAAELSAWLHVEAALSFGPGLIAEDLPEELPKVLRALNA
ncbi:bifunctional ADP-dependent NAD(P)H-hydrate dehydratase/NAD(P)H-hydrate epimerase [Tropicibacter naphthalenivorans]|uniref:Bifunctional NAD(P)H-hydrate repair enzyme n=1 Tax=Tropicibacter naphthalenivorans TaxID=441103 RepID=A0A0P1GFE5_9RHOB|nr:bifunctional ADP-dependent NAD(P)H-hydrate dehydratase/NAD(P)H-hydrate epimerase [Tropicibacter naphthalenivorans]CUH80061.1 Nicotinamide nucleotide repair protein [Tropicibacter naphthalenivorans]SMC84191.1 yjeF C-terminal region, hydroxyethylthiazole kinase-related/yjeF N-terminal region [Tropicibacter naphthalenivorans]